MYKATASGQQFFAREAMHSTKGSRRGFDLLDHGVPVTDVLTNEEKRASLVARWKSFQVELLKWPRKSPERKEIGDQLNFIQNEIHHLRPKLKFAKGSDVTSHFISVCKERLPKALYQTIMDEAAIRATGESLRLKAEYGL